MNGQEIIEMARQAGAAVGKPTPDGPNIVFTQYLNIYAFAKLVAAKEREEFAVHAVDIARRAVAEEREACAKLVEDSWMAFSRASNVRLEITPFPELSYVAKVIRARGEA